AALSMPSLATLVYIRDLPVAALRQSKNEGGADRNSLVTFDGSSPACHTPRTVTTMNRLLRFSPVRLALAYFLLTVLVLSLSAIPLWYAWRVNLSHLRSYVPGEVVQRFVYVFERYGAD